MHPLTCVKYGAVAPLAHLFSSLPNDNIMICSNLNMHSHEMIVIFNTRYYIIVIAPLKQDFQNLRNCINERSNPLMCTCAAIMCKYFDFFKLRSVSFTLFSHIYAFQNFVFVKWLLCAPYRVTVIIYFVRYTLVPLVELLV